MLYPRRTENTLDPELFRNPGSEYRCTPFWAWNCDLNEDLLRREIGYMKQMGMGGFHMHTRCGMSVPYLSERKPQTALKISVSGVPSSLKTMESMVGSPVISAKTLT